MVPFPRRKHGVDAVSLALCRWLTPPHHAAIIWAVQCRANSFSPRHRKPPNDSNAWLIWPLRMSSMISLASLRSSSPGVDHVVAQQGVGTDQVRARAAISVGDGVVQDGGGGAQARTVAFFVGYVMAFKTGAGKEGAESAGAAWLVATCPAEGPRASRAATTAYLRQGSGGLHGAGCTGAASPCCSIRSCVLPGHFCR